MTSSKPTFRPHDDVIASTRRGHFRRDRRRRSGTRHPPPALCRRISSASPIAPATISMRRVRLTPAGAYASNWKHFSGWYRRQGLRGLAALTADGRPRHQRLCSGAATADRQPNVVSTVERRLSALTWNYAQRGMPLDRTDRHIATVLAGTRKRRPAPAERGRVAGRRHRHARDAWPARCGRTGSRDAADRHCRACGARRSSALTSTGRHLYWAGVAMTPAIARARSRISYSRA